MHILYHHRTMGRGAEGVHIASMVRAFEKLGHRVTVVSPPGIDPLKKIGESPLDKSDENVKGINLLWKTISRHAPQIVFEFFEIIYNVAAIMNIRKILKQNQIDLIYERNAYFLVAGALLSKKYKIPLVLEVNETVGIKRARKLVMTGVAKLFEKYSFDSAKAIFTVSSFLQERIQNVISSTHKIHLTPNAIDPEHYDVATKRDEIRSRYGLSNKIVMGFAGWFDWWDRLDLLIDLQKRIADKGIDNVSTLVIGDGPNRYELKQKADLLDIRGRVIFTGPVSKKEVIDYLDALDIGVFSHSNEFGSPVVLFEMMALGKVIVAPMLQPITDVIEHGVNGLIFPQLDTDILLQYVLMIITDHSRTLLGDNAKQSVLNNYTWALNAKKVIASIYDNDPMND